jgi:4-hydroxybenzoyl-CoA reductase subunit beta
MILPKFEYKKAENIAKAIAFYESYIDLKGIEELKAISHQGRWLVIGANVTLFDLKNNNTVKEYFPALYESLDATSCETLQMRGTIGGNILQGTRCLLYNKSMEWRTARGFCFKMGGETCNVVPNARACFSNYCSDNALSLMALSASVKLSGPQGERKMKLEKIFSGDGKNPFTLMPGEILTEIRIPMKRSKGAYEKLRVRGSIDYPLLGVAVSVKDNAGRVCVGGMGPTPLVYNLKNINNATLKDVAKKAYSNARPVSNTTLSPGYRKKMVSVLIQRAIKKALKEGK